MQKRSSLIVHQGKRNADAPVGIPSVSFLRILLSAGAMKHRVLLLLLPQQQQMSESL